MSAVIAGAAAYIVNRKNTTKIGEVDYTNSEKRYGERCCICEKFINDNPTGKEETCDNCKKEILENKNKLIEEKKNNDKWNINTFPKRKIGWFEKFINKIFDHTV